jgi:transcriptional regulator with XRE-family HTH domain
VPTTDPKVATFGPEVRRRRQELGLTIEELAERADLSTNYLGAVERGEKNPSLTTVAAIASGLGVSVRALVTGEDEDEATDLTVKGRELAEIFDVLPTDLREAVMAILRTTSKWQP